MANIATRIIATNLFFVAGLTAVGAIAGLGVSLGMALVFQSWTPIVWGWPVGAALFGVVGVFSVLFARKPY